MQKCIAGPGGACQKESHGRTRPTRSIVRRYFHQSNLTFLTFPAKARRVNKFTHSFFLFQIFGRVGVVIWAEFLRALSFVSFERGDLPPRRREETSRATKCLCTIGIKIVKKRDGEREEALSFICQDVGAKRKVTPGGPDPYVLYVTHSQSVHHLTPPSLAFFGTRIPQMPSR